MVFTFGLFGGGESGELIIQVRLAAWVLAGESRLVEVMISSSRHIGCKISDAKFLSYDKASKACFTSFKAVGSLKSSSHSNRVGFGGSSFFKGCRLQNISHESKSLRIKFKKNNNVNYLHFSSSFQSNW